MNTAPLRFDNRFDRSGFRSEARTAFGTGILVRLEDRDVHAGKQILGWSLALSGDVRPGWLRIRNFNGRLQAGPADIGRVRCAGCNRREHVNAR
ncbi:MAG TPA: hypothetical protein P5555_02445 [Candidatus Paceibacterota bacterium]|nr:hypothetical protein [Verrucomicrobiota bacterium]HOX01120.1 hypothetical protein [Verrucomicrobiota bacterium]HRZ44032.1 hypothetical protein [Candidatus Paceibacterota bacterium]